MASREGSLRNVLATVPGSVRLTDEQRREILAHLDDSVDAKTAAGVPEVEAVAQAFVELGDVRKIVRRFPPPSLLSTPEGVKIIATARERGWTAFGLLTFFMIVQGVITPKFATVFRTVNVRPPLLSQVFIELSNAWLLPVAVLVLVAVGVLIHAMPRLRAPWAASCGLLVLAWSLCLGLLVALSLPLLALLEGIRR